jgi:hypothetical protein
VRVGELFMLVVDAALARGIRDIGQSPGCREFEHAGFTVSVNGHEATTKDSHGFPVRPFGAAIFRGGLPVADITPTDGLWIGLSEDELIRRFREATP